MTDPAKPAGIVANIALAGRSREAIEFWKEAFGALEIAAYGADDGRIRHAEIEINGGNLFLTDFSAGGTPEFQPTASIAMHLAVPNGGEWVARAEAAGCRVVTPWQTMSFGGFGRLVDPFGLVWQIASPDDLAA